MTIERKIMPDASSAEIGPTPAQAQAEQRVGERVSSPKVGGTWYSADYDPKREDYKIIDTEIDPQTGKPVIDPRTNQPKRLDYIQIKDPLTGKEVARIPSVSGGAIEAADEFPDAPLSDSRAKNAVDTQRHLLRRDISKLSPARLAEYQQRVDLNRQEMNYLISRGLTNGVLTFVRSDLKNLYIQATRPAERSYFGSQVGTDWRSELRSIAEGNYKETIWEYGYDVLRNLNLGGAAGPVDVTALRAEFEGLPSYIASRIAIAIEMDLKGLPLAPASEIGDFLLEGIKTERAIEEARRRARASDDEMLEYSDWRERFDFIWAQNRPELKASVFAWLEKFVAHLPEATIEELNNESLTWKRNAISALEKAANRLRISEKEPFYKELKSTIEAYVEVFRGVKFLETDGGNEAHTVALEEFAHNFNAKHDAIYLGNAKSAIIQAFLARNHGEIALGTPAINADNEKPQAGDLEDFRGRIEEEAKLYAATHELYIREADFERRVAENNNGYGWDDAMEELLLEDSRGMAEAEGISPDPDNPDRQRAVARVEARRGVFRKIKARLDKEDEARDGRSFDNLSDDERKEEIRFRIRAKMVMAGFRSLAQDIDGTADIAEKDRKLWGWLKEYNEQREKQGHSLYFPSNWDTVRLSINTSTKLVDRVLSQDELEAMIEEVDPFQGQVSTTGITVQINMNGLTDEEIKNQIDRLTNLTDTQKIELLEDALFDKQQRETEAERAFNINRAYQKFLGVDARWGGMAIRDIDDNGNMVLITIWQKAEELLKAKIDKEEADIKEKVTAHEVALRARGNLTDAQIEEAVVQRRRLLRRDATFGATLALREIGIANDLPIWNYYYYNDPQRIQTFAPLVGYTHNDKPEIVDLLDRGRREMRAVFDYIADTYMDGRILIVRHEPNAGVDENGEPTDFHQERMDRARVINEAGVTAIREVIESRFMLSTSGGIEVVPLISKIGDLGIYDLLWEMGCKDFREFQGFIKRRDEVELKKQSFWNIREWRDPIAYAKRLRGAGAAIPYLRGGEVKGQGRKPGVLQEPMMGAYKYRDEFSNTQHWTDSNIRNSLDQKNSDFRKKLQDLIEKDENLRNLTVQEQDRLVEVGAGILVTLIEYMDALRYKTNRAGLAPKNWKYDNELIFRHYAKELKDEGILGSRNLGYAPQGRSNLAIKIFAAILRTSSYHILVEKDREVLDDKGKEIKARMDVERTKIADQPLPPGVQTKIDNRKNKLRALGMGERIDRLIARGVIPAAQIDSLVSISNDRRYELKNNGAQDEEIDTLINLNKEIQRLKDHYIDEELHKQFVGEWPAKLAEAA